MHKRIGAKKLAYTALFVALIIVGGLVRFPVGVVPITLQTLFVLLAGGIGGVGVGVLSTLIYVILGLLGLPIFSAGGGFAYVLYPTFGYIVAFIFASAIAGVPAKKLWQRITFNLLGVLIIHLTGVIYFYAITNLHLDGQGILGVIPTGQAGASGNIWQIIVSCSLIFLPIDIISAVVSAIVSNKIKNIMQKNRG